MENYTEGVFTYRCPSCETVFGVVSRFGVAADCLSVTFCPKCKHTSPLYGDGYIRHSVASNASQGVSEVTNSSDRTELSGYPDVLDVSHISDILGISKNGAYELMKRTDFPCITIGRLKRAPRDEFLKWLKNYE